MPKPMKQMLFIPDNSGQDINYSQYSRNDYNSINNYYCSYYTTYIKRVVIETNKLGTATAPTGVEGCTIGNAITRD